MVRHSHSIPHPASASQLSQQSATLDSASEWSTHRKVEDVNQMGVSQGPNLTYVKRGGRRRQRSVERLSDGAPGLQELRAHGESGVSDAGGWTLLTGLGCSRRGHDGHPGARPARAAWRADAGGRG
ncbi:hypothetical protein ATANTOWER_028558 [Ataeniobius toweri]|uniref:Uncharacterized protein n=1 Tax=Ataeniobius toweri TaxID=208326 RepID=A0ABU7AAD0_9TELE|nr:hypothetical protein [Ataeniobius toweri]